MGRNTFGRVMIMDESILAKLDSKKALTLFELEEIEDKLCKKSQRKILKDMLDSQMQEISSLTESQYSLEWSKDLKLCRMIRTDKRGRLKGKTHQISGVFFIEEIPKVSHLLRRFATYELVKGD
jgi:hypothetical protein